MSGNDTCIRISAIVILWVTRHIDRNIPVQNTFSLKSILINTTFLNKKLHNTNMFRDQSKNSFRFIESAVNRM